MTALLNWCSISCGMNTFHVFKLQAKVSHSLGFLKYGNKYLRPEFFKMANKHGAPLQQRCISHRIAFLLVYVFSSRYLFNEIVPPCPREKRQQVEKKLSYGQIVLLLLLLFSVFKNLR